MSSKLVNFTFIQHRMAPKKGRTLMVSYCITTLRS